MWDTPEAAFSLWPSAKADAITQSHHGSISHPAHADRPPWRQRTASRRCSGSTANGANRLDYGRRRRPVLVWSPRTGTNPARGAWCQLSVSTDLLASGPSGPDTPTGRSVLAFYSAPLLLLSGRIEFTSFCFFRGMSAQSTRTYNDQTGNIDGGLGRIVEGVRFKRGDGGVNGPPASSSPSPDAVKSPVRVGPSTLRTASMKVGMLE